MRLYTLAVFDPATACTAANPGANLSTRTIYEVDGQQKQKHNPRKTDRNIQQTNAEYMLISLPLLHKVGRSDIEVYSYHCTQCKAHETCGALTYTQPRLRCSSLP